MRHFQDEVDFLEKVSHRDGFEFLQDQVNAAFDEKGLVFQQRLIETSHIARFHAQCHVGKRRQIVLLQKRRLGHLTLMRKKRRKGGKKA